MSDPDLCKPLQWVSYDINKTFKVGQVQLVQVIYQVWHEVLCPNSIFSQGDSQEGASERETDRQDTQGPPELLCLQPTGSQHQVMN